MLFFNLGTRRQLVAQGLQHHHMSCALHTANRLAQDTRKRRLSATLHLGHLAYQNARRVNAIHAAGGQHIAHFDVSVGRHKAQL